MEDQRGMMALKSILIAVVGLAILVFIEYRRQ
jgi:hypothetical protein